MLCNLLSLLMGAIHEQCMCDNCSEEDSGTEQPSKVTGRRKTKTDHITVEYLRDHDCFDMPLAVRLLRIIVHAGNVFAACQLCSVENRSLQSVRHYLCCTMRCSRCPVPLLYCWLPKSLTGDGEAMEADTK